MSTAPATAPRPKLLLDGESARCVQPTIAVALGTSAAFILQQLHFRLSKRPRWIGQTPWVGYTAEQWQEQLPFLSVSTIRRTLRELEADGYIESARLSRRKSDRTKWYTIDYEAVDTIGQDGPSNRAKRSNDQRTKMASSCRSKIPPDIQPSQTQQDLFAHHEQPVPETWLALTPANDDDGPTLPEEVAPLDDDGPLTYPWECARLPRFVLVWPRPSIPPAEVERRRAALRRQAGELEPAP